MSFRKYYSDDDVITGAKQVLSISGLLRFLGLKVKGGNYKTIKRRLQRLNIDTSHWTGQGWNKNQQLKDWSKYTKTSQLKKHLIKLRTHKCECCLNKKWQNKDIPLEIHHIDGYSNNNKLDNLQLLCPNCHALTDNYRGRKNKVLAMGLEPIL